MALHIERVPLSTEKKALKVLRLCQQHDLKEQGEWGGGGSPINQEGT